MKREVLWCGLSLLLVAALVLASCVAEVGEQEEEEEEVVPVYTETNFTVYADDTYRFNFFLNEGETFEYYWKASDYLQCWYTNSYGQAKLIEEIQIDPNIGRLRLWEPGEIPFKSWMEDTTDWTSMKETYGFIIEYEDNEGNFVEFETLDGGRAGDGQIEADRTGYYTLNFYIFYHDIESVDVVMRYR